MKPLLVGEAPSRTGRRLLPFADRPGGSGARLARLFGVDDVYSVVDPVNLTRWPYTPGDGFLAARLLLDVVPHDRIVLVGRRVARAFDGLARPLLVPYTVDGRRFLQIPHPSGRNRFWNDPASTTAAGKVLRTFCRNP